MPDTTRVVVAPQSLIGFLKVCWAIIVETVLHPFSPSTILVIREHEDQETPMSPHDVAHVSLPKRGSEPL